MTDKLLRDALEYFPTATQQHDKRFAGWQVHIEMVRQHLLAHERADRQAIYEVAQSRIHEADLKKIESHSLWLFSHPSFEVFEGFLRDEPTCRSMADFLDCTSIRRRGNRSERTRKRRLVHNVSTSEARFLAVRYGALLRRYIDERFTYVYQSHKHQFDITLMPEPRINEESIHAYCQRLEENVAREELHKLKRQIERSRYDDFNGIYGVQVPRFDRDQLPLMPDDIITFLEISDFVMDIPATWKPMMTIDAIIAHAVRDGMWIKFTLDEVRTVKPKYATIVNKAFDDALLKEIREVHAPERLRWHLRKVRNGLLPIGLKIHCADARAPGVEFLQTGYFSAHNAGTCFNLPPVGSIEAVREILDIIHQRAGVSYLDNPDFQIQVCSPGVLTERHAALLGIGFYLGSDRIRRYRRGDFITTHHASTGDRLIIYGAHTVDTAFDWWAQDGHGLAVTTFPVSITNRTDVLTCQSMKDIENVNLIASLLVHERYGGYWRILGRRFIADMEEVLTRHHLSALLRPLWVKAHYVQAGGDDDFFDALEELANYAHAEVARIRRGDEGCARGILFEVQDILAFYRTEIAFQSATIGAVR